MADAKTTELVEGVQAAIAAGTLDVPGVVRSLESLLQYLCSPEGLTDANCRFVDSFFMEHDEWEQHGLPDALHDVFADIAGALHDTFSNAHIARNFESTPDQLLARLRSMSIQPGASPKSDPADPTGNSAVIKESPSLS